MSGGTALHPSRSPASSLDATRWLKSPGNPPRSPSGGALPSPKRRPARSAEDTLPLRDATHRNEFLTPRKGNRGYESETGGMLPHKPKARTCAEKQDLQQQDEQRWLRQGEGGAARDEEHPQDRRAKDQWAEAGLMLQEARGMPRASQQWLQVSSSYPIPERKGGAGLQQEARGSASSRSLEPRSHGEMGPSGGDPRPPRQLLIRSGPGILESPPAKAMAHQHQSGPISPRHVKDKAHPHQSGPVSPRPLRDKATQHQSGPLSPRPVRDNAHQHQSGPVSSRHAKDKAQRQQSGPLSPRLFRDKAQPQDTRAVSPGPATPTWGTRAKNKSPGVSPLRQRAAEMLGRTLAEKSPQRKATHVEAGAPSRQAGGAPSVSPSRGAKLHVPSSGGVAAGAVAAIAAAGKSRQWAVSPQHRAKEAPTEGSVHRGAPVVPQSQGLDGTLSPVAQDENLAAVSGPSHARDFKKRDSHQLEPQHYQDPGGVPAAHQLHRGAGAGAGIGVGGTRLTGSAVGLSQGRLTSALGSSFRAKRLMEFLEDSKLAASDPWDEESMGWQAEDAYSVNGERLALAQGLVLPGEEEDGLEEGGLGQAAEEMEAAWLKAMKQRKARPAWAKRASGATGPADAAVAAGASSAAAGAATTAVVADAAAAAAADGVEASKDGAEEASARRTTVADAREELRALDLTQGGEEALGEQERPTARAQREGSPGATQAHASPLLATTPPLSPRAQAPVQSQENSTRHSQVNPQAQAQVLDLTLAGVMALKKEEASGVDLTLVGAMAPRKEEASRVEEWVAKHFWAEEGGHPPVPAGAEAAGGAVEPRPGGLGAARWEGGELEGEGEGGAAEQLALVTPQLPGSREAGRQERAAELLEPLRYAGEGEEAGLRYTRSRSAGRQWRDGVALAAREVGGTGEGEQSVGGREETAGGDGEGWAGSGSGRHPREGVRFPSSQSPFRSVRLARGALQEDTEGPAPRIPAWCRAEEEGQGHRAVSPPSPPSPGMARRANTGARVGALSPFSRLVGLNSGHTKEAGKFLSARSRTQTGRIQQQQQQQNMRALSHQYQYQQQQHQQQGQGVQKVQTYKQAQQRQLELAEQARRMGAGAAKARQEEAQISWPQAPPAQGVLQPQRRSLSPNGIRLLDLGGAFAKKAAAALLPGSGAVGAQGGLGTDYGGLGSALAEGERTNSLGRETQGRGAIGAGAGGMGRSARSGARKTHTPPPPDARTWEAEGTPRSSARHQRVHTLHSGGCRQSDAEERLGGTPRGDAGPGDLVSPRSHYGGGHTRQGRDRDRFKAESGVVGEGASSGYTAAWGPVGSASPYSGPHQSQHSSQSQNQGSTKKPGKKWGFPFRAGAGGGQGGAGSPPEESPVHKEKEKTSHQKAFPVPPLSLLLQLPEHHQAQGQGQGRGRSERRLAEGSPLGAQGSGGGARGAPEGSPAGSGGAMEAKSVASTFPPNPVRASDWQLPQRYRNKSPIRISQKHRHQPSAE